MPYIVQAFSKDDPGNAVPMTLGDRKEALAAAEAWMGQGFTGIRITGEGRVYMPIEFALTMTDD